MDIATLGLEIRSDGVVVAKNRLKDFEGQADRTEKRAAAMGTVVGRALGALGAAFSIRAIVQYADAWSDMQSRVGAAIKDMDAAPALMQRIVDIANASYSPLAQTVEIYGRNVAVLKDLGLGANEAADFTESLNHMLVITATRGERAASVQNALSKAMAVGKLQAEGLETVLANGGRVAQALADELGTTVSGLRGLASQGKITGSVIAQALLTSLEDVRVEAGEMTATVADAFVIMNNNITAAIGQFDKAHGVSAALAEGIIFLANNLDLVASGAAGLAVALTVALLPAILSATTAIAALTVALASNPLTLAAIAAGAATTAFIALNKTAWEIEGAIKTANSAYETNASAMDVAKASSEGYTAALRNQIAMQVEAARSAAILAQSEWNASIERSNWFKESFGGATFAPFEHDRKLKGMNERLAQDALWNLEQQLAEVDANMTAPGKSLLNSGAGTGSGKRNPYADLTRGAHEFIAAQQLEAQALGMTAEAASRMRYEQDLLNKAANDNIALTPDMRNELAGLAQQMAATEAQTKMLTQAANDNAAIWSQAQDGVSGIIKTWARGGDVLDTISNKLLNIGDMLIDMAVRDLFGSAFGGGMGGGGGGGGIFSFLGGLFGGFRANGGPVQSGMTYMVGERGPELFSPSVSGRITPNHSLPSANQNQANDNRRGDLHLHINGSGLNEQQLARAIANGIRDYDEALAPKVEAKFQQMQNDPRAADGSW